MRVARYALVAAVIVGVSACGGQAEVVPESTTFISVVVSTTEGPTPNGPAIASEGDVGPVVATLQWLLTCGGHGDLTVDGVFGPATATAVESAQATARRERTGEPDAEIFAALSRACSALRPISFARGVPTLAVASNAAPGDPDEFLVDLVAGYEVTARVDEADTEIAIAGPDGVELHPADGSRAVTFTVDRSGGHVITVIATSATDYNLSISIPVRVSGLDEPIPVGTVDAMLGAMFSAIEAGDVPSAMTIMADEVAYTGLTDRAEGADGRTAVLASLTRLAGGYLGWESTGVDWVDGEVVTFGALADEGGGDPVLLQFAARLLDGRFEAWWEQPADVEGRLLQLFRRAGIDDLDGAMTLVAEEITFHAADGTVIDGSDGREAVRDLLGDDVVREFVELRGLEDGLAAFTVSTVAADPDLEFYAVRVEEAIVEWWIETAP